MGTERIVGHDAARAQDGASLKVWFLYFTAHTRGEARREKAGQALKLEAGRTLESSPRLAPRVEAAYFPIVPSEITVITATGWPSTMNGANSHCMRAFSKKAESSL